MKAYVYILKDQDHRFYIGSTRNVEKRIKEHTDGMSRYTKRLKHLKLVLMQEFESITIAKKVELKIKRLKRKDYVERMIKDGYIKLNIEPKLGKIRIKRRAL